MGDHSYLIRYGVMRHVGRFPALPYRDSSLERGQLVVIQTDRGVELGEVLIALDGESAPARGGPGDPTSGTCGEDRTDSASINSSRVLRVAGADDLSLARSAEELRSGRFSLCQRILREGNWPWELVDVEPLLDGRATVLHYLGPHQLDVAPLRARFRVECDLDVVLEPVGNDLESELSAGDAHDEGIGGGCGSCGCSDGGGCGSAPASVPPAGDHRSAGAWREWVRSQFALRVFLLRDQSINGRTEPSKRLKRAGSRRRGYRELASDRCHRPLGEESAARRR